MLALLAAPSKAEAGAWTLAKEQSISTGAVGWNSDIYSAESSVFFEQPIEDTGYSVTGASWLENRREYAMNSWRGEVALALKAPLDADGEQVSAIQAGVVWRSDVDAGCSETGAELRWLGGSVLPGPSGAFANLEIAGRAHSGGCTSVRFDVTAGYRPASNWLALAQIFTDAPDGGEQSYKVQLSLVRFGAEDQGVQLGLRGSLDDDQAPLLLVLGLWN